MRMFVGLSCVVLACGGTQSKPQPKPEAKPQQPQPVAEKKPEPPAKPSCATVATKLLDEHGFGKIPDANKTGARRGGEAEIVAACLDDRWPDAALACMATRPSAVSCVGQLTTFQQKSFDAHLKDWEKKWIAAAGEEPGEEENATEKTKPPKEEPHEEWVSCEIAQPAEFPPVIAAKAHAHDLAVSFRKRALDTLCYRWTNPDKKCFNAARDAVAIQACRGKLDEFARNTLDNTIADADAAMKKIETLEKTPKAIDCKTIANEHYKDEAWRGHLTALPAAERKRVAAESRTKLAKVCTDEKWSATERACFVVLGTSGNEREISECFPEKRFSFGSRWGFPAGGVLFKTGIAECDELGDLVKKIAECDKFDKDMKQMILESWTNELGRYLEWRSSREDIVKSCKQTTDLYKEGAKERGCSA